MTATSHKMAHGTLRISTIYIINIEIYRCILSHRGPVNWAPFCRQNTQVHFIKFRFHWILQWSILIIIQHQFRYWLGIRQETSHYLKQWSPCLLMHRCGIWPQRVNSSPPGQNGCHFTDDIFKCIFMNNNVWISIRISLEFVPKGLINNIPALVQIMAWRGIGYKPLSEPMLTRFTDAYIQH